MLICFSVPKTSMAPIALQKQMSSKYKGKLYHKFVVVLPNELIDKLGWKAGQELTQEVQGKSLILKPQPRNSAS